MAKFSDMFAVATEEFNKGDTKGFAAYADMVAKVTGSTAEDFLAAFTLHRAKAAQESSITAINEFAATRTVTKTVMALLNKCHDHVKAFTIAEVKDSEDKVTTPGYKPKLTVVIEYTPSTGEGNDMVAAKAAFKVIAGKVSTRSGGGKGGTKKGRISLMNAYKWVNKNIDGGERFKLEAADDGGTRYWPAGDTGAGRYIPKKGLTKFLLAVENDCETLNHARSYDGMTSLRKE